MSGDFPGPNWLQKIWERLGSLTVTVGEVEIKNDTGNPVPVSGDVTADIEAQKDIFGHLKVVQPYNQIEMRLDAATYTDFTDQVLNSGTISQANGLVTIASGVGATNSPVLYSADSVEYRPGVGVYGAGTAVVSAGAAGCEQFVGLADNETTLANALGFARRDGVWGILHRRGNADVSFTPQASWDDPCGGAAGSLFTLNDTPIALDPENYGGPYWLEAGLFGFAGWQAKVWSPDRGFIVVHTFKNNSALPVFESNTFKVVLRVKKTSGGASHTIKGQCWAAGTGSALIRMGGTTTDRTLAMPVLAVLRAKKPSGDYINIDATAGGNLKMSLEEVEAGVVMPVSATDLDIRNLAFASDKVDASGSAIALDAATLAALESVTVSATDLDIRDLAFATDKVDASGSVVALDAATLAALETVGVTDGGGSLTVDATDLDIRDLTFAADKVDASGTSLGASTNNIGDVDVLTLPITQPLTETQARTIHVLERYKIADEASGATAYYGFLANNGDWYIMQEVALSGTYRYANLSNNPTITGGYSGAGADKAWANRATLTYDYFNVLTGL